MQESNGKWQVGFWVMSFLCTVWLVGLTGQVIANDRLRFTEDQRIEIKTDNQQAVAMKATQDNYIEIIQRLTRIESRNNFR